MASSEKFVLGENVKGTIAGKTLTLEIDLDHRGGLSSSKKTTRVASTCGNLMIPGTNVVLGLNSYTK